MSSQLEPHVLMNDCTLQLVVQASSYAERLEGKGIEGQELADIITLAALNAALFFVRRHQIPDEFAKKMILAATKTVNDNKWFEGLETARVHILEQMPKDAPK